MSRLPRYIDSLNKFIKDRSCISKAYTNADPEDSQILIEVKNNEIILPILFLTIMNSQNKKQKITAQGYYAATSIVFLNIIISITENKENYVNYDALLKDLIIYTQASISQNLDNTKHLISSTSMAYILNLYSTHINKDHLLNNTILTSNNEKLLNDVPKLFINGHADAEKLLLKYNLLVKVNKESFDKYIERKYGALCEIALCTSWIIGCGNASDLPKIKKLAKQFTFIYKICLDFESLEKDLRNISGVNSKSKNYVINNGIQFSCDTFLNYKQQFIENCMLLEIFSNTIKEILNYIEKKVDFVINQTTPDLKSNFTASL